MAMYVLQNEELKVSVASAGAELKSALDQKTGREYLWNADPAYWNRTSPVLFPVVGSYKDKTSYYDGKAYTMGQHGFARDMEFTLESSSDTEIWFVLRADETTYEKYPFDFELHCGYSLQGRSILVMWKVVNPTDGKIWFSIGAHPAFNCAMEGWKLRFRVSCSTRKAACNTCRSSRRGRDTPNGHQPSEQDCIRRIPRRHPTTS